MALLDVASLQKLSELLKPEEEDLDDQIKEETSIHHTPASIGQSFNSKKQPEGKLEKKEERGNKDIWDEDEIVEGGLDDNEDDERPSPEYEILFKQKVTTDDIFLGMTGKNQSTACCEDLLVKIQLPDTEKSEIELDVQDTFINCQTTKFRLLLHLPHKVSSKNGKADWDQSKEILSVTLPLDREYDFMNL